jgi:segregation and condensation protein B
VPLSRAARETLAIIAYRQPVTRAEVDEVRGVDCAGVVKVLLERGLIRTAGHREEPGRPTLYVTTRQFLEFFHLKDLTDLPTLREFTELSEEHRAKLEALGVGSAPSPIAAEAAEAEEPTMEEPPRDPPAEPDPDPEPEASTR